ncbi:MAG: gliding motility-associated C-terminal domain-containing protein [Dysgonomonas sp.]
MAIVNRWGVKMYESTDPAKGWDGRYKGKYVNTGVYFYVIEAQGSDGVKYRKRGDINILRGR